MLLKSETMKNPFKLNSKNRNRKLIKHIGIGLSLSLTIVLSISLSIQTESSQTNTVFDQDYHTTQANLKKEEIINQSGLPQTESKNSTPICTSFDKTFEVTNKNNTGNGSLRQAILNANNNPGCDKITFNIQGDLGPYSINITETLPVITSPVKIDGTTQPGYVDKPVVGLHGINSQNKGNSGACLDHYSSMLRTYGLCISGTSAIIKGLAFYDFANEYAIIHDTLSDPIHLEDNYIGLVVPGLIGYLDRPNEGGVWLDWSKNGKIVNNVISNNLSTGLFLNSVTGMEIKGNRVGVNPEGVTISDSSESQFYYNGEHGIKVFESAYVNIGGPNLSDRNIISGNQGSGVEIKGQTVSNVNVTNNLIGLSPDGSQAWPNSAGILIMDQVHFGINIGGCNSGEGNFIAGNLNGLLIKGHNNSVKGNIFDKATDETTEIANTQASLEIIGNNNSIGGEDTCANSFAGNSQVENTGLETKFLGNDNYNDPITVKLKPLANNSFSVGESVTLEVDVLDIDNRLTKIEYWMNSNNQAVNGIKIGESDTAPYNITYSGLPVGAHNIYLKIIDSALTEPIQVPGTNLLVRYNFSKWVSDKNGTTKRPFEITSFKNNLFQSYVKDDNRIYTRSTSEKDVYQNPSNGWTEWTTSKDPYETTFLPVSLGSFGEKIYHSHIGSNNRIYTRGSTDGVNWGAWITGADPYEYTNHPITMTEFDGKFYQTHIGGNNRIYTRSSTDGSTWGAWITSTDPYEFTKYPITMTAFDGKFYQAHVGGDNKIYTRSSTDGNNWTGWIKGTDPYEYTNSPIALAATDTKIYTVHRGADSKIYTRSSPDGKKWSGWTQHGGSTELPVSMTEFDGTIYQGHVGEGNYMYWRKLLD